MDRQKLLELCYVGGLAIANERFGDRSAECTCQIRRGEATDDYLLVDVRIFNEIDQMIVSQPFLQNDDVKEDSEETTGPISCGDSWIGISGHVPIYLTLKPQNEYSLHRLWDEWDKVNEALRCLNMKRYHEEAYNECWRFCQLTRTDEDKELIMDMQVKARSTSFECARARL